MARHAERQNGSEVVARLLEAERRWDEALVAERAASELKIRSARAEAVGIAEVAEADIAANVKARQTAAAADTTKAIQELEHEFSARVALFGQAPERAIDAAAAAVAELAPWPQTGGGTA